MALLAALMLPAQPCRSQETGTLPAIEVIGRYEDALGTSDAASQGVVTRPGIEKRPLLRPGEVLESVPGLIVTQHPETEKRTSFSSVATTSITAPISRHGSPACR